MTRSALRHIALPLACAGLAGCAALPSTGPSASGVARQAARVEAVTPEAATAMWNQRTAAEQQRVADTLGALASNRDATEVLLYPGASLTVTLWTEPQWSTVSSDDTGKQQAVNKTELGVFSVDGAGDLTLPYVGAVPVAGRSLKEARELLNRRFALTRKFQSPQTALTLKANAHQQIVVTGAANHPTLVDWRDGGVSLGEAITLAGGNLVYEQGQGHALSANHVVIMHKGTKYELPLKAALESGVQLRPNDQVLLEHQSAVNIQCLGGGWTQNTVESFDETPSLSRVVAMGGGLSTQQAQGRSVFVLSADRQVIYAFKWDTLDGVQAAQAFPLQDGDIVYIATAPIVHIQQVANILFSAAYPVTAAKGAY